MAHKQKTNKRQYAWVANGYVPDSRYEPIPHKTMDAAQYQRAHKVRADSPLKPFECHYYPRGESAHQPHLLPRTRVYAVDQAHACTIASRMLHRRVSHAIEQVCA